MIRELVHDTDIQSQKCEKATIEDEDLANDLLETAKSLDDAACLAANQIGQTKQIIVFIGDDGEMHLMLNPRIKRGLYPVKVEEECLTIEGIGKTTRFAKIEVIYDEIKDGKLVQRKREYQGDTAQAIQHAIDHCNGKLI